MCIYNFTMCLWKNLCHSRVIRWPLSRIHSGFKPSCLAQTDGKIQSSHAHFGKRYKHPFTFKTTACLACTRLVCVELPEGMVVAGQIEIVRYRETNTRQFSKHLRFAWAFREATKVDYCMDLDVHAPILASQTVQLPPCNVRTHWPGHRPSQF